MALPPAGADVSLDAADEDADELALAPDVVELDDLSVGAEQAATAATAVRPMANAVIRRVGVVDNRSSVERVAPRWAEGRIPACLGHDVDRRLHARTQGASN